MSKIRLPNNDEADGHSERFRWKMWRGNVRCSGWCQINQKYQQNLKTILWIKVEGSTISIAPEKRRQIRTIGTIPFVLDTFKQIKKGTNDLKSILPKSWVASFDHQIELIKTNSSILKRGKSKQKERSVLQNQKYVFELTMANRPTFA